MLCELIEVPVVPVYGDQTVYSAVFIPTRVFCHRSAAFAVLGCKVTEVLFRPEIIRRVWIIGVLSKMFLVSYAARGAIRDKGRAYEGNASSEAHDVEIQQPVYD
eukprot:12274561-Karenia_brevis.AAC.2